MKQSTSAYVQMKNKMNKENILPLLLYHSMLRIFPYRA